MALLNKLLVAGMVAAGSAGCSPSPLDRNESPALTSGAAPAGSSDPAGAPAPAPGDAGGDVPATAAAGSGTPIPQYLRVATPPGGVEEDIGLKGVVRIRDGCIKVIDESGQDVLPIFPAGARWTVPGKEIRVGDVTVEDGRQVVWSVQPTRRDFRDGRPLRAGEQDVPAGCAASRYVRVLL